MIRQTLLAAAAFLALAACNQKKADATAGTLRAAPLATSPSYDAFCQTIPGGGACVGQWTDHPGGQSSLGPYRFIEVEFPAPRDGQGPAREVLLELTTARGVSYRTLGRSRAGKVTTSVIIKDVVDHPDALELKMVFRTSPRLTYSDYYSTIVLLDGPNGPSAVEVALGKIVGDIDTGKTTGAVGDLQWQGGKLAVKGATVKDGVWAVGLP